MAHLLPRRRSARDPIPPPPITTTSTKSSSFSISPSFILLLFLTIWCTSNLLSSSFHLCVSSRKLDLYCISGGLNPSPLSPPLPITTTAATTTATIAVTNNLTASSEDNAHDIVRDQLRLIRSWASPSESTTSCTGKGVFVYDLPSKFNHDLLSHCHDLLPWTDLCEYLANDGKGQPIPSLGKGWYHTHQYSLELIFHSKVLTHPCRVSNPDDAKLFYVPFYAGLDVLRWHFKNASSTVKDGLGLELLKWLEGQKQWKRNEGRDHMFVLGKIAWDFRRREEGSWGSKFLLLDEMRGAYKFLIERQPWEMKDVGVPHPTHFHPSGDGDVVEWQGRIGRSERRNLVTFAGAARPEQEESIRSLLIKSCVKSSADCRYEC